MTPSIDLELLPGVFSVARLPAHAAIPTPVAGAAFWSVTATGHEISVVCAAGDEPAGAPTEPDWRALRVLGRLDFALTGVVAGLTTALAAADVSVFVVSTFDTDYLLVKRARIDDAITALRKAGYAVNGGATPRR